MAFIATIKKDAKAAVLDLKAAADATVKLIAKLEDPKVATVVEGVTASMFGSAAADAEKVAFSLLAQIGSAIETSEAAATSHLASLGLDESAISAVKSVVAAAKAAL